MLDITKNAFRVAIATQPRGAYAAETEYFINDTVTGTWDDNAALFVSRTNGNTGNALPVAPAQATDHWQLVNASIPGEKGDTGDTGDNTIDASIGGEGQGAITGINVHGDGVIADVTEGVLDLEITGGGGGGTPEELVAANPGTAYEADADTLGWYRFASGTPLADSGPAEATLDDTDAENGDPDTGVSRIASPFGDWYPGAIQGGETVGDCLRGPALFAAADVAAGFRLHGQFRFDNADLDTDGKMIPLVQRVLDSGDGIGGSGSPTGCCFAVLLQRLDGSPNVAVCASNAAGTVTNLMLANNVNVLADTDYRYDIVVRPSDTDWIIDLWIGADDGPKQLITRTVSGDLLEGWSADDTVEYFGGGGADWSQIGGTEIAAGPTVIQSNLLWVEHGETALPDFDSDYPQEVTQRLGANGAALTGPVTSDLFTMQRIVATVPAANDSPGTKGDVAFDESYRYDCIDTDTWVRSAIEDTFGGE